GMLTVVFNDCNDDLGTCTIKSFASGGAFLYGSDLIAMSRRSVGLMVTVMYLRSALTVARALMITPLETVCTAGSKRRSPFSGLTSVKPPTYAWVVPTSI